MKVAFLNNQIDNRGTGNALYDYAHYNEEILGNESIVATLNTQNPNPFMEKKLALRFKYIYTAWDLVRMKDLDYIYHIKSGELDSTTFSGVPYGVHAVFNPTQPHGTRYATISSWMSAKYGVPFVPHIVRSSLPTMDFRMKYNIPKKARVFGRHGGSDTFDISWAWDAVNDALYLDKNVYFLFLNTDYPQGVNFYDGKRVVFVDQTADENFKASFIGACDAMLHARSRGETFGIAVGEFAVAGKTVLTYGESGERAHLEYLGPLAYVYNNKAQLLKGLMEVKPNAHLRSHYDQFTPEKVMSTFKEVFLDGI